jgi:hypothetical protein
VTPVGEPFTLVNISTWPYENAESAHIAWLPLTVVALSLELLKAIFSLRYLSCKKPLSVVFAFFPFAGVAPLAVVEN